MGSVIAPGLQLVFDDDDGVQLAAFATSQEIVAGVVPPAGTVAGEIESVIDGGLTVVTGLTTNT